MSSHWFYVENDEKVGPLDQDKMISLIKQNKLTSESYVWTTGFDNWKKLFEVDVLSSHLGGRESKGNDSFDWSSVDSSEKSFYIMVGKDRGRNQETLYGPYSLDTLAQLYRENRINGRSYIWCSGMASWCILADISVFEKFFGEHPPEVTDIERRAAQRRPFIARMLFHDGSSIYEGICRDISLGGMQVLVADFPAQLGENISFNVHPDNSDYHFVASGEIVRILEGDQGFSFRFTELSQEAKSAITKYLNGEL